MLEFRGNDYILSCNDNIIILTNNVIKLKKLKKQTIDFDVEYLWVNRIKFIKADLFALGSICLTHELLGEAEYLNFKFGILNNSNALKIYNLIKDRVKESKAKKQQKEEEVCNLKALQENERLKKIEYQKVNNPDEYQRKKALCEDIFKEYTALFKTLSNSDFDIYDKVQVIKECNRKLDVIYTTNFYNDCFDEFVIDEEKERVNKKAIAILNKYIKDERDSGAENCDIDITQFSDDLDFIYDWISEKDEKLNK